MPVYRHPKFYYANVPQEVYLCNDLIEINIID